MPKYRVELTQTVIEGLTLYVEAADQEAAEALALEQSLECPWDFIEVSEREVTGCKEITKLDTVTPGGNHD